MLGSLTRFGAAAILASGASVLFTSAQTNAALLASDDFNRDNNVVLGVTPVGGYTWKENEQTDTSQFQISSNVVLANSRGSGTDPSAILLGLSVENVDISATLSPSITDSYFGGITYRRSSSSRPYASNPNPGGYSVDMTKGNWDAPLRGANSVSLRYNNTIVLAVYNSPTPFDVGTDYVLRAVAVGSQHKVYLNGTEIISFTDPDVTRDFAGFVGFGTYYGNWSFDNFNVSDAAVPEPASCALATIGLGMLARRRRM